MHIPKRQLINQEHSHQNLEWGSEIYFYKASYRVKKQQQFFTVIGHSIRIFINDRESVSGYLISTLGNSLCFAYDFQKHKEEITQVKLVLHELY